MQLRAGEPRAAVEGDSFVLDLWTGKYRFRFLLALIFAGRVDGPASYALDLTVGMCASRGFGRFYQSRATLGTANGRKRSPAGVRRVAGRTDDPAAVNRGKRDYPFQRHTWYLGPSKGRNFDPRRSRSG